MTAGEPRRGVVLTSDQRAAVEELFSDAPVLRELGARFAAAGEELAVVGGPVRDALLGRRVSDLDLTTSARPERVLELVRGWADTTWEMGIAFGTIGMRRGGSDVEITTYRADAYDPTSRKPVVAFGDSLVDDLRRRDFTINAMAIMISDGSPAEASGEAPAVALVDPYGGVADLDALLIRTPGPPEVSFTDDPLRMMRAARFASQLAFEVEPATLAAVQQMTGRLAIVSAERVRDELVKLVRGADPRRGLAIMVETGLAELVLPELPALSLEIDEHHRHKDVYEHTLTVVEQAIDLERADPTGDGPDFTLRFAALMHDVGKPRTRRFEPGGGVSFHHHEVVGAKLTRKRMSYLRFPKDVIEDVCRLVELHLRFHGYSDAGWTDSAVRRYVRDAGDQLDRLHKLTRADCTTRNQRKATRLRRAYDELELRIAALREQEELDAMRPDLDGNEIIAILGVPPGPAVGRAYRHLLDLRLEHGPLGPDRAEQELRAWWAEQQPSDGA